MEIHPIDKIVIEFLKNSNAYTNWFWGIEYLKKILKIFILDFFQILKAL
jgi:hypothetical protein